MYVAMLTCLVFLLNKGTKVHPSAPPELGGRGEGREQPQPHPCQRHQSLRVSPEEVPRMARAAAL